MPLIRNKLNQRIVINLMGGKSIDLLAKGRANVSKEELSSSHLQALISKGDIVVIIDVSPAKGKKEVKELKQIEPEKERKVKRKLKG